MKKIILGATTTLLLVTAPAALADRPHHRGGVEYARVLSATPVYRSARIARPQRQCWDERVVYRDRASHARDGNAGGAIVGAIAGAVVGHQFGKGRGQDAATVAGALIGAGVGQAIAAEHAPSRHDRVTYAQHCGPGHAPRYAQYLDGYDVTYRYRGRIYHSRLPYDPGDRVAVHVDVRPIDY